MADVTAKLAEALRRAFALGQTYWQQADSESFTQNAKSEVTHQKFRDLMAETLAAYEQALAEPKQAAEPVAYWLTGTECVEFERQGYHDGDEWEALFAAPVAQAATPAPAPTKAQEALKLIATASPGEHAFEYMRGIARAALAATPAPAPQWVPVSERLPGFTECCDWLYPTNSIKRDRWVLCSESMFSASVPGRATHWRHAMPLPAAPGQGKEDSNG